MAERITVMVRINLDGVPGAFHTADDTVKRIQQMLEECIPHYNPKAFANMRDATRANDPNTATCYICDGHGVLR